MTSRTTASAATCRLLDFNLQVGQRLHQLLVKLPDSVAAFVVFAPGFVVVACSVSEGVENAFKVVRVLKANVKLDNCDACRPAIIMMRKKCACHVRL